MLQSISCMYLGISLNILTMNRGNFISCLIHFSIKIDNNIDIEDSHLLYFCTHNFILLSLSFIQVNFIYKRFIAWPK